jgi:hypothetical protein
MRTSQSTPKQIHDIKHLHLIEKFKLKALEEIVEYRINNPELIAQRNIVRKLKDKIIESDSYNDFLANYVPECKFQASDYCDKVLTHTYIDWCAYGNCCRECTKHINRHTHKVLQDKIQVDKTNFSKIMDELSQLDMCEDGRLY